MTGTLYILCAYKVILNYNNLEIFIHFPNLPLSVLVIDEHYVKFCNTDVRLSSYIYITTDYRGWKKGQAPCFSSS